MSEGAGWADAPGLCRCARTIENCSRIKMVVARASVMDLASSLRQNAFLTLGVRPTGGPAGSARDGGQRRAPGRGAREGPRDEGPEKGPRDGGPRRGPTPFWRSRPGAEKLWDDFWFCRYDEKKSRDTKKNVDWMLGGQTTQSIQSEKIFSVRDFFPEPGKNPGFRENL